MAKPGTIAFPVLLVLGAITGYLAYDWMVVQATPKLGVFDNSPYYKPLSQDAQAQEEEEVQVNESDFENIVTISIPSGASIQGSTSYDPGDETVPQDALIKWVNDDNVPHTATSGSSMSDPDFGQAFDTGFLDAGKEYSVPASELGAGEHAYFCTVHPYMTGTVTVQ